MATWVQVSDKCAINTNLVTDIFFGEHSITVGFVAPDGDGQLWKSLTGHEREAFLLWWENKAEVYKAG